MAVQLPRQSAAAGDHFFLPDLCTRQAQLILVLLALLAALLRAGTGAFEWTEFALLSLFMLWSVVGSAVLLCLMRNWLARQPLALASTLILSVVLAVVAFVTQLYHWLFRGPELVSAEALLRNLLVALVVAGTALRYAFVSWQLRRRQQGELAARIESLQSRMQPHFLFNTLNSIASLIPQAPAQAERAVEDLATLLRVNLRSDSSDHDWLAERDLCERYLRIEQLRLGERLRVNWQVDDVPPTVKLPPLTLQPLLENAILHGIQQLPSGGTVTIDGHRDGKWLSLRVDNPVPDNPATAGRGMALDNVDLRLRALYGDGAGLQVQRGDGRFAAELRLPAEEAS